MCSLEKSKPERSSDSGPWLAISHLKGKHWYYWYYLLQRTSVERNISIAIVMCPLMNSIDGKSQATCDPCSLGETGRQVVAGISYGGLIRCWGFKEPGLVGVGRESSTTSAWNNACPGLPEILCFYLSPVDHIWWGRPDWRQCGRI